MMVMRPSALASAASPKGEPLGLCREPRDGWRRAASYGCKYCQKDWSPEHVGRASHRYEVAQHFAPWIGAMTTIAASIAAYGLLDRRKYLVSSYAAMQSSLERILARDQASPMSLADLVTTAEDLFESEHKAWFDQMLATKHAAPGIPGAPPAAPRLAGGGDS